MRKLGLALCLVLLGLAPAQPQPVTSWPPPAGTIAALCVYNSGTQTYTSGSPGFVQCDVNGNLKVAGSLTLTGATSNASDGVATSSTNVPTVSYNYGFNGTTWDRLQVDASKFLKVNCSAGCGSGTNSNASSAVATSSTNQATVGWLYGFNGATWDQLQVDVSKSLKVTNQTAEQAGENHIGEVGGNLLPITNDMTTTNATITTGQSIGGLQTLANAVRVSGSLGASGTSGLIQSVMVSFKDAVATSQIDVFFFNANPTGSTCTNASAFILADADRDKVIGVAHVTDFTAGNAAVVAQAMNQAMPFGLASTTSAFACAVARGSFAITGTANASLVTRILRN